MEGYRSEKLRSLRTLIKWATQNMEKTDPEMTALAKILEERTKISSRISMCLQLYTDHPDKVRSIRDYTPATGTQETVTKAEEFQRCMRKFMKKFSYLSGDLKGDRQYLESYVDQLEGLVELVEKTKTEEELYSIQTGHQSANVSDLVPIRRMIEEWERMDLYTKVKEHFKELKLLTGEETLSTSD